VPTGLAFDRAGLRALISTRFAGLWRTGDGGDRWAPVDAAPAPLGCLAREPGGDRIWACSDPGQLGPWVLGTTDDLGQSWSPRFRSYADIRSVWPCPVDSAAVINCRGFCPGRAPGESCDDLPVEGGLTDGGLADAGHSDAGPAPDAAIDPDATARRPAAGGGCAVRLGAPPGAAGALLGALALLIASAVRRRL